MMAKSSGFTLIEVLLAMALFAIAGVALLGTAGNSSGNLLYLQQKTYANWVASNQLTEAVLSEQWPPQNNKKGKLELAKRDWFWQQKVLKTTDNNLRAIIIEVRLKENDELPSASMMTYVAKPSK
ncbi:type II secretion system minor pseudopilin GspI [Thalassotalea sp. LPB0316]|uniref:type II secretion system minor pseudopilin GspI n=1 Tax=Thalassotalea sp. LPB0316 TaxID=2769490 RepID=UPI00186818FD|nr:type II secretion system minor pseudopilin GspI [Thalassotalea sp. LPB0316]QOL26592.1 type II secretion system minor pseudopilin GspI [Thalassotalea sp. LPB0316]